MEESTHGIIFYKCIGGDSLPQIAEMMVRISRMFNQDCVFIHNDRRFVVSKPLSEKKQVDLVLGQHSE